VRQEIRTHASERKQKYDERQRVTVLHSRGAKEIQDGRVHKVVPQVKNRNNDEEEEENRGETSRV
jgi:hypothetical protein